MRIKQNGSTAVSSEGLESSKFGINLDRVEVLMRMLSTGIYSDPVGSTIREYVSNAWDSHRKAGQDKPIVVTIGGDHDGHFFQVKDFGTGLPFDQFESLFIQYLGTDKDQSDDDIGGFGIGSKSAFSVSSSYYVSNRYEGKEELWAMYKDGNTPKSTLISSTDTDEPNGITVKIYINNPDEFHRKADKQLMYFDNVVIEEHDDFNSNQLIDGDFFCYSPITEERQMHIKSGVTYYPIDFSELEMEPIRIPVALKFDIGELEIAPSREHINYSEAMKELVKERIELVKIELLDMVTPQVSFDSYRQFHENYVKSEVQAHLTPDHVLDVSDIASEYEREWVRIKGFGTIDFQHANSNTILEGCFEIDKVYNNGFKKPRRYDRSVAIRLYYNWAINDVSRLSSMLIGYVKEELNVRILMKAAPPDFKKLPIITKVKNVSQALNERYNANIWRKIREGLIKEFGVISLYDTEIPEDYKQANKDRFRVKADKNSMIVFYLGGYTYAYNGYNYRIKKEVIYRDDLDPSDLSNVVVSSDRGELDRLKYDCKSSTKIKFIKASESNAKWIIANTEAMSCRDFIAQYEEDAQKVIDWAYVESKCGNLINSGRFSSDFVREIEDIPALRTKFKSFEFTPQDLGEGFLKSSFSNLKRTRKAKRFSTKVKDIYNKYEFLKFFNLNVDGVEDVIQVYLKSKTNLKS